MSSSSGLYFAVVAFVVLICVGQLTAINQKIDSLHKISKIKSYRLKSDSRLTTDLDNSFNSFKRKDHIGKKIRKTREKAGKRIISEERSAAIKSSKTQQQELSHAKNNITTENKKRQYIYGSPSAILPAGAIPRQFVAYPNAGLHRG